VSFDSELPPTHHDEIRSHRCSGASNLIHNAIKFTARGGSIASAYARRQVCWSRCRIPVRHPDSELAGSSSGSTTESSDRTGLGSDFTSRSGSSRHTEENLGREQGRVGTTVHSRCRRTRVPDRAWRRPPALLRSLTSTAAGGRTVDVDDRLARLGWNIGRRYACPMSYDSRAGLQRLAVRPRNAVEFCA